MADLLVYLYWTAVARDADDGRTVFSRQGGGTRVGERLADAPLRMWSDPRRQGIECDPVVVRDVVRLRRSRSSTTACRSSTTDWIADGELKALIRPGTRPS